MKKSSFALKFQLVLLILLFVTFIMMAQTGSNLVFRIGIISLIVLALIQIAVGNIDLSYNGKQWIKSLGIIMGIEATVIGVSMLIVQWFLNRNFVTVFLWVLIIGTIAAFVLFIILGSGKKKTKSKENAPSSTKIHQ